MVLLGRRREEEEIYWGGAATRAQDLGALEALGRRRTLHLKLI
jgi:hypothetical protein